MLDVLIAGGGLAGSLLAWRLRAAGRSVLLLDAGPSGKHPPAWQVAAGLAAPVSGQRATLLPEAAATLAEAEELYPAIELALGARFWRPRSILRCFTDSAEAQRWQRRAGESAFRPYLRELDPSRLPESKALQPLTAAFEILQGAHLDINGLVPALQAHLLALGSFEQTNLIPGEVQVGTDSVRWRRIEARHLAFCEGLGAQDNPLFPALRFQATRGELLELRIPGLDSERVLYGRHFLIPLGEDRYLCGATYDRVDLSSGSTAAGREELESGLRQVLRLPFTVTGQRCGLRPNVLGHTALWERHPQHARLWRLNGLGSKGSWLAPRLTRAACQALTDG